MAFNGLLQGAMKGIQGGAEAGVYAAKGMFDDQRKVDVSKQLADIEEEKLLRIDEVKRQRDIADIPLKGAAETQVAVDRGNNKDYLTAERNVAKSKHIESSGSIAQANLANYQMQKDKQLNDLKVDLSNEKDPTKREQLKQRITDLSSSSVGNYSDVVKAAESKRLMAKEAREDAKNAGSEEEAKFFRDRAKTLETEANSLLGSVTEKRIGNNGTEKTQSTGPKEGDESVSKSGKAIKFQNGQWVYK